MERSPVDHVSPVKQRLARRVTDPDVSIRTEMLEIASGLDNVIKLGVGDPDLDTPKHIVQAAKDALDAGVTHYTHPSGDIRLRAAIAADIERSTGISYDPATEIIVTTGVQEAVYIAMLTLVEDGAEVLLPAHRFASYDMAVELSGGRVVTYPTIINGRYALDSDEIQKRVTQKSVILNVVSPDNPTGGVATPEEIAAAARLACANDLIVLSDEIYSRFVYDDRTHVSIVTQPNMRERTLLANGLSKCYAMTGWRVGYLAGPADYMRSMVEVKHTLTICTPVISQVAALAALEGPQESIEEMRQIYDNRRHTLMGALSDMNLPFLYPAGAFYIYVDISPTGMTSPEFCMRLLKDTGVMILPGTMFGSEGERYVRMSLLAPDATIIEAVERMEHVIHQYQRDAV